MNIPQWIAGCMEVEGRMAELYGLFADRFDGEADMFANLEKEEQTHLKSLGTVEVVDEATPRSLEREAMVLFRTINAADQAINKARTAAMNLEEALEVSLSLEEGIVENFVTSLSSTGLEKEREFNVLVDESTRHADMIKDAMRRNGFIRDN